MPEGKSLSGSPENKVTVQGLSDGGGTHRPCKASLLDAPVIVIIKIPLVVKLILGLAARSVPRLRLKRLRARAISRFKALVKLLHRPIL
jgi:hypothetical protein